MSGVKRWWVFKEQLLDEKVHRFDSDGAIPVVLASDYDAEVAAHEMTAHELKCAEANWDNLRLACDEKERVGDAFLVRAEKAEAERDDERTRHLVTQRKLAEMWAERDAAVLQTTNRDCQIIALKATVEQIRGK